ncbi:hypothetical protein [Sphingomonas sp.]|uniref:hypothetical protein n=1 Tax=Sphingomonas sp. TaxID=28214 RepID=UPI000DAF93A9|nr:hypothetical protein [Sphingomonas sp.]PZU11818.1 MAG: hypothetical protein DI605_02310 [Sphingomonas sp.]
MEGIGTVAALGGLILAIVLLWAVIRNRTRTPADRRRTEDATRALNRSIDRQDKVTDPDPGRY